MDYTAFLQSKRVTAAPAGFEPTLPIDPLLRGDQAAIVRWSLRRGRAAVFADTGGSEGVAALELGRRFVGIELKRSYWQWACRYLDNAAFQAGQPNFFDLLEAA